MMMDWLRVNRMRMAAELLRFVMTGHATRNSRPTAVVYLTLGFTHDQTRSMKPWGKGKLVWAH